MPVPQEPRLPGPSLLRRPQAMYAVHISMTSTVIGTHISINSMNAPRLICHDWEFSCGVSMIGVLKNVWLDVRESVGDLILEVTSLTPKKVPGRRTRVTKVMTLMDAESLAVARAISSMLSVTFSILIAESSILSETPCPLRVKSLFISMLYDWRMVSY